MWRPSTRTAGPLAVIGALCLLAAMVPLEVWTAPHPGDSYVFNPPRFSGIWAERVAVPVFTVAANVLILVALYGLYRRDTTVMLHWQRGSAKITLFGAVAWLFGTYLVTSAGPNDILGGVFGGLVAVLALLLTIPGLAAWGIGYFRTGQQQLGAALTGAPVLTFLYLGISLSSVDFEPVGGFLLAVPTAAMAVLVGYDLWVNITPPADM